MSSFDLAPDEDERRQAAIVSPHLDPAYTADLESISPDQTGSSRTGIRLNGEEQEQESSLKLQGGDIHRDLYKLNARASPIQRAQTFSHVRRPSPLGAQRQPGGFRRQFLLQQHRASSFTAPITSNFVSFLDLYGAFAGEDLAESEDEDSVIIDEERHRQERASTEEDGERRPLLRSRRSSRSGEKGDATLIKTFFLLIKSFIGTGVLFLPKAFKNGGILFSSITMLVVSLVSSAAFHLLLQCRSRYGGGGYGDIGEAISGKRMRSIILASITISQIGFVCAGIIFTAENIYSFIDAVGKGSAPLSAKTLIAIQLLVLVPLALIRKISKLSGAALLADVFIALGLGYIYYFDFSSLATEGINKTVNLFNPRDFTLTVGSSIFTFEGIGLILPIQSSMKSPQKFEKLLYVVMFLITIIFTSIGALTYATFGDKTNVEIISNFPQDDKLVNTVQFLYALAILVGTPVQLFPAVRILEGSIFGLHSGKRNSKIRWKKNAFRAGVVAVCGVISALGAADLDKFVALIGCFACVPLVYIYPPYLHFKGVAESRYAKAGDILFMVIGLVAMVYTTTVTVVRWSGS